VPRLQLLNCLWLLLPVFTWNAIFAPRLPQAGFKSDAGVPRPILATEQALRIAIFLWPLLLPLRWQDQQSRAGLILYFMGLFVYFASWLPLLYRPEAAWSKSPGGLLAPAFTPLLWLIGIALVGGSWPYALLSVLFVAVHVYHNVLAHGLASSSRWLA
jgi:hypothetical protein